MIDLRRDAYILVCRCKSWCFLGLGQCTFFVCTPVDPQNGSRLELGTLTIYWFQLELLYKLDSRPGFPVPTRETTRFFRGLPRRDFKSWPFY